MRILIRNGQVVDPSSKTEGRFDVLVEGDRIVRVAEQIERLQTVCWTRKAAM